MPGKTFLIWHFKSEAEFSPTISANDLIDHYIATVFQHASMLECSCHIISYLADVMNALRQSSGQGSSTLLMEGEEKALEVDSDWVEELAVEDDDSQAEDSVRNLEFLLS